MSSQPPNEAASANPATVPVDPTSQVQVRVLMPLPREHVAFGSPLQPTAAATASVEMMIANQAAAVAAAASVSEKKYKRLRDENTALRDELAALKVPSSRSTSIVDEDAVMLLVTKMLEKHKRNSRSLEARVDAIETTQVTAWNDDDPSNGDQLTTHLTKRRHLSAIRTIETSNNVVKC